MKNKKAFTSWSMEDIKKDLERINKEEKKDIFKTKLEKATGKEVIKHPKLDIYGF
jgi:hypothetical protein|tara:strand:- start:72 stop:236 length:165 start_codon:yes stop_codon:yes gene_type:complete